MKLPAQPTKIRTNPAKRRPYLRTDLVLDKQLGRTANDYAKISPFKIGGPTVIPKGK